MNASALTCPTQQELAAFAAGKLDFASSAEIEQHLAECPSCCQLLKLLPDESTLVSLLRDPKAETAAFDRSRPSPAEAATLPPAREQLTTPPGEGATEITQAPAPAGEPALPAPLASHPRYRVTQLLGRGGMGDVYKAHHRLMNRPVALKIISAQLVTSHAAIERFHREVQAAARLSHPNIVTAYDAEQAGDAHFLVMEFVDGIDLATLVREQGPLTVAQACDYIRQAADGLEHAHQLGMVHRDIKPQNLMVTRLRNAGHPRERVGGVRSEEEQPAETAKSATRDPQSAIVKILDFGLASFATETAAEQADQLQSDRDAATLPAHLTRMGSLMGTPDYISPEQARDAHSADIRSDIYSLGCTLYYLLTGQPPFGGDSVLEKVVAHLEREPKRLSDVRSDIPAALEDVLKRMMAKDPAERFQTPAQVASALAPFAAGRAAITPRPAAALVPLLAIAAGLALAFLGAVAGVVYVATDRGRVMIQSEVDDVQIAVLEGGRQIDIIDLTSGSKVTWLKTGNYELRLVGDTNDVQIDKKTIKMTRLGNVIVTATWNRDAHETLARFNPPAETISRDAASLDDGGWKITAPESRTVRLFETPLANLRPGPFYYRAKLKTEKVGGRAFLEMWVRFPGEGEYFSKGFHNAVSGTNGWSEYEVPFLLKAGQQPDLVKLNLTIEGAGTVWIKDIELRGRTTAPTDYQQIQGEWIAESGQRSGQQTPVDDISMQRVVFSGDAIRVEVGKKGQGRFQLLESSNPKQILLNPDGANEVLRGIYKLEGDRLTLCMDNQGGEPPTSFAAPAGTTLDLIVLRRLTASPREVAGTSDLAQGSQPRAVVSDEMRLQGKWVPLFALMRTRPLTEEQLARMSLTFTGNRVEFTDPESGESQAGTFTINAGRTPKQIDFIAPDGKESMPGIYQFEGDRLKLALIDEDYARPTDFLPSDMPDHMTATFERAPLVGPPLGKAEREVLKAAEDFLAVVDSGRFGESFDRMSMLAKRSATRGQVSRTYQTLRDLFGKATHRTLQRVQLLDEFPGLPPGRYAAVQYKSDHERRAGLWESLLLNVDADGQWRVNTYGNTLEPLPFPEPKDKPQPPAGASTPPPPAPTPPPAVPTGDNLITDPSLEGTAPGEQPLGERQ